MGKRTVSMNLDPHSIGRALRELEEYKRQVSYKAQRLGQRVAERIEAEAGQGFASAIVDDLLPKSGSARTAEVSVRIDSKGNTLLIIASGEDAIWAEFGAGVYHNGAAGSSPHPSGQKLGFTIGTYGKGHGSQKTWGFYDNGELKMTHGAPASMPMYRAMRTVCAEIDGMAREVFLT